MAAFLFEMQGISLRLAAVLWVFYLLLVYCFDLVWVCWKIPTHTEPAWWVNRRVLPFYTTFLVSVFLVYVFFFASRV
jgi:hypothetical protein